MASLKSLPSWLVALGAGATSIPVVGPWVSATVHHRYLGPTVVAAVALGVTGLGKLAAGAFGHVRPRLAAWLELLLVRWFSRFGPWYRRVVLTDSRSMGREGFGGLVARGLDLDRVYIAVSLVSRAPRSASPHLVRSPGVAEGDRRQDISSFLHADGPSVLVILGGPGSGKSTLLRRIARQAGRSRGRAARVPIFLALREHAAAIVADPRLPLSALAGRAKAPLLTGGTVPGLLAPDSRRVDALVAWFESLLLAGRCVVLLDGLDEVATEDERSAIVTWANTQILRHPGNDYLLSSRPDGYRAGGLDDADVLEVEPFTTAQVNAFVVEAYDAVGSREAARRAADLSRQLGEASRLRPLTRNPLLLTMLYFVHRDRGSLPASRLELYRQICRTVLADRQKDKRIAVPLPVEQSETLLSGLALAMTREGRATTWARAQVLDQLRPHMRALPVTAEDFLDMVGLHGLFVESGIGRYAFTHRTFQEYLSAVALAAAPPAELPVDDPWWHETLLFYALLTGPDPVVRACLAHDTVTAWTLAFDCADQATAAQPLDPRLVARLDRLLTVPADEDLDPARRKLLAGVLATRHLRDVVHTDRDQVVCARLVPSALYRLFLDDTATRGTDPAVLGEDDQPVVGVLGGNADAFVRWFNEVGAARCRLPTRDELTGEVVRKLGGPRAADSPPPSVWLAGHATPTLWTGAGHEHPWAVSAGEIRQQWHADLKRPGALVARLLVVRCLSDLRLIARLREDLGRTWNDDPAVTAACDEIRAVLSLLALSIGPSHMTWYSAHPDSADKMFLALSDAHVSLERQGSPVADAIAPAPGHLTRHLGAPVTARQRSEVASGRLAGVIAEGRRQVLGHRIADALDRTVRDEARSSPASPLPAARTSFAQHLGRVVQPLARTWTVPPEDLGDLTRIACRDHRTLSDSPWSRAVTWQLAAVAEPVFAWRRPVAPDLATQIRFGALCLASEVEAEAEARGSRNPARAVLAGRFRDIAAGVTLLGLRTAGPARPTEGILLAVD
ncbi:NACHT domain-containing protein [Longispora sp. K20-0274]|uniref:NACHT domain-containing protein n=1 Tax=Longispora sp. K20-0274 TaxID=3088255 RepID=UPI003999B565